MAVDPRNVVTYTAPTNIAVIKYWGKFNVNLNTPMNSSVSVTLEQDDLHTITSIAAIPASDTVTKNRLWLNGKEVEINSRGVTVISELLKIAGDRKDEHGNILIAKSDWKNYKLHISSVNTFPTGAGLASSAAGLACLVKTLSDLYCCVEKFDGQLTAIARQGSGSASRSLYGGFVEWQKGEFVDGSDSIAIQVADENHWPELAAIILVVSEKEKDTSSTSGMETSKNTSELLKFRASNVVDTRMKIIKEAYLKKDFETFGRITMKDSNQFHATCLDTYPPIFYMNDTSSSVIRLVHAINKYYGKIVAAYTFDAGPNAVIYTLNEHVSTLLSVFSKFFPLTHDSSTLKDYCNKPVMYQDAIDNRSNAISNEFMSALEKTGIKGVVGQIKYCFVTRPGPGPVKQPLEECIIDLKTGEYKAPSEKHKRLNIGATPTEATAKNTCCGMKSCCDVSFRDQVIHHALVGIGIIAVLGYFYGKKCCRK